MDLNELQTALPAAIRQAAGVPTYDVTWTNRRSAWKAEQHCRLQAVSMTPFGRPDLRYDDDGLERMYQPVRVLVQVTCVTASQELDLSALRPASKIHVSLRREDCYNILTEAGVGLGSISPLRMIDFKDPDGRWRSCWTFDLRLNLHVTEEAEDVGDGFVSAVEYGSNLYETDIVISGEVTAPFLLGLTRDNGDPYFTSEGDPIEVTA